MVRPLESGSRAVGGALEFPEFSLADRTAAVEPCAIQLEALAAVARFVTQPVSLVARVPSRVVAVERKPNGRRNHYTIKSHLPVPDPIAREQKIGDLLAVLTGIPD